MIYGKSLVWALFMAILFRTGLHDPINNLSTLVHELGHYLAALALAVLIWGIHQSARHEIRILSGAPVGERLGDSGQR